MSCTSSVFKGTPVRTLWCSIDVPTSPYHLSHQHNREMRVVVQTNLLLVCPPEHRHVQGVWPQAKTEPVNEAISQLAFADVVLLNKEDLMPREQIQVY